MIVTTSEQSKLQIKFLWLTITTNW